MIEVAEVDVYTARRMRQEGAPVPAGIRFVVCVDGEWHEFADELALCEFLATVHPALFADSRILCSVRRARDEETGPVLIERWSAIIDSCAARLQSYVVH